MNSDQNLDKSNNRVGDYLFLVILLIGCSCAQDCEEMTQSDALPLQWVPEGVKTFNEQRHCGIERRCWYQPWRCDVDVIDQLSDGSIRDYVLRALDSQGVELFEKPYDVISFNLFQQLKDWTEINDGNTSWTGIGTSSLSVGLIGSDPTDQTSNRILCNAALFTGKTYRVFYDFTVTGADNLNMLTRFRASGINQTPFPSNVVLPIGSATGSFDVTVDANTDSFSLEIFKDLGAPAALVTLAVNSIRVYDVENINTNIIYSLTFNPYEESICKKLVKFELWDVTEDDEAPEPIRISRTDLMDFRDSDCISAWDYTSGIDYAGLTYVLPDTEDTPIFRLCIEGVFAHERDITEEVAVELTQQTIGTATSLKKQRLLTVQDAPDFFHRKIELMLAHGFLGSVTDDLYSRTWLKEEKYEKEIRDRRYILKEGNVQLTDINYLKRGAI